MFVPFAGFMDGAIGNGAPSSAASRAAWPVWPVVVINLFRTPKLCPDCQAKLPMILGKKCPKCGCRLNAKGEKVIDEP